MIKSTELKKGIKFHEIETNKFKRLEIIAYLKTYNFQPLIPN